MNRHVLCGALFATTCLTSPALAQSINDAVPPQRQNLDANFVDRATGSVYFPHPALTIGPAGRSGLSVTGASGYNGNSSDNGGAPGGAGTNWGLVIYTTGSTYTVGLGQTGDTFTFNGNTLFASSAVSGATLSRTASGSSYTYTAADGTQIVYDNLNTSIFEANSGIKAARATRITYPTGEVTTLTWVAGRFCTNSADACAGGTYQRRVRLQSVSSSLGYQMQYNYAQDAISGGPNDASSFNQLFSIQAVNTRKDACAPGAGSCSISNQPDRRIQIAATWSGSGSSFQSRDQFTDPEGRVSVFTNSSSQLAVQTPGHGSANIIYTLSGGQVTNVTRDGLSYRYDQSVSGTVRTMKVTDPLQHQATTTADTAQYQLLTSTDGRGYTTTNAWDPTTHRLAKTSFPEGNAVEYQYDDRGNVTQTTLRAKNGTDTLTTSASYPDSCTNALTCNQPSSTTDANRNTTNYTYDPTHGGIVTVTRPAVNGVAPVTTYSYGQPNNQPIWRLSTVSACQTQASCAGGADEVRTWYSNFDDNLNVTGVHAGSGDHALEVVNTATYDAAGNQLTGTDGNTNATRTVFNKDREVVGTIGTDPDGIGTGNWAKAQRITRDGHGWVGKVEEGTAPGQSDSDWNSFSSHREVDYQYDDAGRKTRQTLRAGSTNYAETQFSYDGDGRLDCTAVRMNPGAFGQTTSACDLGSSGSFGPDRIGRNEYDAADEVTRVWSGYRSGNARPEDATYTPNGKVQTRLDGKGNRTGYVYDGFDRLFQVFYPDKTNVGASSSNDYEQFQYDGNGNPTFRFLRQTGNGITYRYDALDRLTAKTLPGYAGDVNANYTYDNLGRLTSMYGGNSSYSSASYYSWDALGRKLSENNVSNGHAFNHQMRYDAAGRMTSFGWGDGVSVGYTYDRAGRMTAATDNGGTQLFYLSYDDDGRRVALCPNGTAGNQAMCTQYGYDAVSRLNGQNLLGANGTNMTFAYNPAGQIVQKGNSNDAYAWAAAASTAKGYAVNGLNQYTGVGGSGLGYDEHGNLTSWNGAGYAYNAENRLTGKGGTALQYDSAGRLLYVTGGTHLDYDGDRLVGELDNNGNPLRRYVYGPDPDEPVLWYEGAGTGDKRFLAADERGSVIRVQRADGSTLALDSYDEYGQPGSGNQGRFGYTGQAWLPEVGLWYYKARMYAPQLGRFMQTDPIGYADGMNWYNYAGGDPVNNVDPSGLGLDDYNPNVNNDGGSGDSGEIVVTGVNCGLHPGDSRCGGVNVQVNIVNPRSTNISLNDPHFSTLTSTQSANNTDACGATKSDTLDAFEYVLDFAGSTADASSLALGGAGLAAAEAPPFAAGLEVGAAVAQGVSLAAGLSSAAVKAFRGNYVGALTSVGSSAIGRYGAVALGKLGTFFGGSLGNKLAREAQATAASQALGRAPCHLRSGS